MQRTQTTRYERVLEILDKAAEKSTADYEGLGKFWRLSLDELLEAKVGGVRLVEPGHSDTSARSQRSPHRSHDSRACSRCSS